MQKKLERRRLPHKENSVGAADCSPCNFCWHCIYPLLMMLVVCLKKLWRNAPALASQCLRYSRAADVYIFSDMCKKCQSRRWTMRHFAHWTQSGAASDLLNVSFEQDAVDATLFWATARLLTQLFLFHAHESESTRRRKDEIVWAVDDFQFVSPQNSLCVDWILCANNENVLPRRSPE